MSQRGAPTSLVGKTAWSGIATLASGVASAAMVVVIARTLGLAGAGRVAYGIWAASVAAQVAGLALPHAAMRFLANPADRPGVAAWLVRITLLVSPAAAAAAGGITAAAGHGTPAAAAAATLAPALALAALAQGVLSGAQSFRRLTAASVAAAVLQVVAVFAGARLGGAAGALFGHAVGQLPLALALVHFRGPRAAPDAAVRQRIRTFAGHTWLALVISLIAWSRLEFSFLEAASGPEAVALYTVALTLAQLGTQPILLLGNALLPHFAELLGNEHSETTRETFGAATRVFAFIGFPLCFGTAALASAIVPLVFGAAFTAAALPAAICVSAGALLAVAPAASSLVYAHDRTRFMAVSGIASGAAALALFCGMIPSWGIVGAAVARSAVQGAGILVGFWYVARRLGIPVPLRKIARAAAASAIAAAAGWGMLAVTGVSWGGLACAALTVATVYAVLAMRLAVLDASDAERISGVLNRFPAPLRRPAAAFVRSVAG